MANDNGANGPAAAVPAEGVVREDLLGTAHERRGRTRIDAPAPAMTADGAPPVGRQPERVAPVAAAPGHSTDASLQRRRRPVVGLALFALIAAAGAYVGLRSPSVRDALRTVSVILVGAAVAIYVAAFAMWVRDRRRGGRTATDDAAAAAPASPVATPEPSGPPHVPTLAEVAAELDAVEAQSVSRAASAESPVVAVPAVPAVSSSAAPAVVPPPPVPAVTPRVPEVPLVPVADVAAVDDGDIDDLEQDADLATHDESVMDAIAPYTEVVGQPVFHEHSNGTTAASAPPPPPPMRPTVVPPPPPPPRTAGVVPPPPAPALPPAPAAVPALPDVATPPPPARTAAEVFAAMTAASAAGQDVVTTLEQPEVSADVQHVPPSTTAGAPGPGRPDAPGPAALVPSDTVAGWTPPLPVVAEGHALGHLPAADVAARSAVGSVAPVIVYRYRKWVLGQMLPGAAFDPVDVDRSPDEWLLLATCGVATLLAWTHEDHHFTYPVETWAEEILPAHGVRIRDRELARDLILAAAMHAGGVDSVPTERLRTYAPADLVTAMASIHVGLLRLYCGLGHIGPERVLADQYGIGPGDIPLH